MAYNDDAVLARLSALNDSHDSIATAAQWIMFHRYIKLTVGPSSLTLETNKFCIDGTLIEPYKFGCSD